MTNLSDTQRILLSTASQRENGSVLPLAQTLTSGGGTAKAIAALIKRGLAEERETDDAAAARRVDGDVRYGLFITAAGAAAIGAEPQEEAAARDTATPVTTAAPAAAPAPKRETKAAIVLALLARAQGATLPELIEATGWLPHTTRAALTGLRKKGHDVIRGKRDGVTCYSIAVQA